MLAMNRAWRRVAPRNPFKPGSIASPEFTALAALTLLALRETVMENTLSASPDAQLLLAQSLASDAASDRALAFDALCVAAGEGDLQTLRFMKALSEEHFSALCRSRDDASGGEGFTPLMFAAYNLQGEAVEFLLAHSDARQANNQGESALHLAARVGDSRSVALLAPHSEAGAVSEGRKTALTEACFGGQPGHLECVRVLAPLETAVSTVLGRPRETALQTVVRLDHLEHARVLLDCAREAFTPRGDASAEELCFTQAIGHKSWRCADWFSQWAAPEALQAAVDKNGREKLPRAAAALEAQALRSAVNATQHGSAIRGAPVAETPAKPRRAPRIL